MVLTSPSLPGEDGVDGPAGDEGGVHHQPEDQEHGQGEEDGGHLHTLQVRMFLSSGFKYSDCKKNQFLVSGLLSLKRLWFGKNLLASSMICLASEDACTKLSFSRCLF